jgi:XTP/dITP diphosphohydrolase
MIIIAATQNKNKLEELRNIFTDSDIEIISIKEAGLDHIDVEEDQDTFEGNSMKKAEEIMKISGKPTIADDSGLEVDALGGRPGVYSARYAGEEARDQENNKKLLEELAHVKNRKAKFVSVISMALPDGKRLSVRGECSGKIAFEEKGQGGFGYDPLFIVEGYDQTFSELGNELKNKISHRARACEKFKEAFIKLIGAE